jgi:hypothetical protein
MSNLDGRPTAVASISGGSWQVTLFSYDHDGQLEIRYTYTHATGGTSVATALNTTLEYERNLRGRPDHRRGCEVGSSPEGWTSCSLRDGPNVA